MKGNHQRQRDLTKAFHLATTPSTQLLFARALMYVSLDTSCNLVNLLVYDSLLCHASYPASV